MYCIPSFFAGIFFIFVRATAQVDHKVDAHVFECFQTIRARLRSTIEIWSDLGEIRDPFGVQPRSHRMLYGCRRRLFRLMGSSPQAQDGGEHQHQRGGLDDLKF